MALDPLELVKAVRNGALSLDRFLCALDLPVHGVPQDDVVPLGAGLVQALVEVPYPILSGGGGGRGAGKAVVVVYQMC